MHEKRRTYRKSNSIHEYSVTHTQSTIQSIPYNTIAKHLNVIAYFEICSRLTTLKIPLSTTEYVLRRKNAIDIKNKEYDMKRIKKTVAGKAQGTQGK
jgi:hypothetical protein